MIKTRYSIVTYAVFDDLARSDDYFMINFFQIFNETSGIETHKHTNKINITYIKQQLYTRIYDKTIECQHT